MKVLIVGGGGREHALAWKVAQSSRIETVFVAPGNAGTAREPKVENVPVAADAIAALTAFARDRDCELTIVGPEAPLVAGIVDAFESAGLACLGPSQAAAQLEGSKAFTKAFLARHDIPTAAHATFTELTPALDYVRQQGAPLVIKADGLAAGKGVTVARSREEAEAAVNGLLGDHALGEAGDQVVIEEYLEGEEASFIALVGGGYILPMASAQDHKPRDAGDQGPNTGGMGAYSPAPVVTEAVHERIMDEIIIPTIQGLAEEGVPYTGFLYAGVMITPDGAPQVLEFNCRLGDPEAEPIMMRLRSDLVTLGQATIDGTLGEVEAEWDARPALGVVLAASGYPGPYHKGDPIHGLEAPAPPDTKIFHAGTQEQDHQVITAGGRVLCVCALGDSVAEAQTRAYKRVQDIHWDGMIYRPDIGHRAVAREHSGQSNGEPYL